MYCELMGNYILVVVHTVPFGYLLKLVIFCVTVKECVFPVLSLQKGLLLYNLLCIKMTSVYNKDYSKNIVCV